LRRVNNLKPTTKSILVFATLIAIGTVLLMLPCASARKALSFVDALFTATSATCVTGLIVVDTGRDLSSFGQAVVLALIQVGGLGIMTVSTVFLLLAGGRPGLSGSTIIQDTFTHGRERSLSGLLKDIVRFTLLIEGAGAAVLFFRFLPGHDAGEAFYLAVFHAISAFCNAGFSLFSDSFVSYREDWVLNVVVCLLIVSGGIGFLVLREIKGAIGFRTRLWMRLSLHSKIVLSLTFTLLLSGAGMILWMEWGNTLAPLPLQARFFAAFFQSTTARTAGFNTLVIGDLAGETLFLLILLMYIGASPGSCGGGIKITTISTLIVIGISRLRGHDRPQIYHRTISQASVGRAISVLMLSAFVVAVGLMLLLMTESGSVPYFLNRGKFLELLFEAVSAFGTVGLSMGATGSLSGWGKIVVTLLMFVGRLGPLVVGVAVSRKLAPRYYYAEENIMIG